MDYSEEETLLDVQHSPLFKLKRKVLFMSMFLFYFLCGLEYSITGEKNVGFVAEPNTRKTDKKV